MKAYGEDELFRFIGAIMDGLFHPGGEWFGDERGLPTSDLFVRKPKSRESSNGKRPIYSLRT